MLLESFRQKLTLVRGFGTLSPESLGKDLALAFVVEIEKGLLVSDQAAVELLPEVGTLIRQNEEVAFKPAELFEQDARVGKLRLADFLDSQKIPFASFWRQVFEKPSDAQLGHGFSGQELVARLGTQVLRSCIVQDPLLEHLSLETVLQGIRLVVHDAICCGAGIELETVGSFLPRQEGTDFTFVPDENLRASLRGMNTAMGVAAIKPPKFSKIGTSRKVIPPL